MRTFWTFCGRPKILWCEFDNWYIINMETQDDCFNCQTMRQQIEQLKQKHLLDFKTIKQKIISTDELIKLYQKKCQEFDKQATYITELTGKLEGSQRNLDVIKLQLEKSIELNEPLKKKCDELEKEKQNGTVEVQKLNDRLKGSENLIKQLKTVIKEKEKSEEVSRLDVSIQNQEIESQKKNLRKNETVISRLKEQLLAEKNERKEMSKQLTISRNQLKKFEKREEESKPKIAKLTEQLHQAKKVNAELQKNISKGSVNSPSPQRRRRRTRRSSTSEEQNDEDTKPIHTVINELNDILALSPCPSLAPLPPSPAPTREDNISDDSSSSDDSITDKFDLGNYDDDGSHDDDGGDKGGHGDVDNRVSDGDMRDVSEPCSSTLVCCNQNRFSSGLSDDPVITDQEKPMQNETSHSTTIIPNDAGKKDQSSSLADDTIPSNDDISRKAKQEGSVEAELKTHQPMAQNVALDTVGCSMAVVENLVVKRSNLISKRKRKRSRSEAGKFIDVWNPWESIVTDTGKTSNDTTTTDENGFGTSETKKCRTASENDLVNPTMNVIDAHNEKICLRWDGNTVSSTCKTAVATDIKVSEEVKKEVSACLNDVIAVISRRENVTEDNQISAGLVSNSFDGTEAKSEVCVEAPHTETANEEQGEVIAHLETSADVTVEKIAEVCSATPHREITSEEGDGAIDRVMTRQTSSYEDVTEVKLDEVCSVTPPTERTCDEQNEGIESLVTDQMSSSADATEESLAEVLVTPHTEGTSKGKDEIINLSWYSHISTSADVTEERPAEVCSATTHTERTSERKDEVIDKVQISEVSPSVNGIETSPTEVSVPSYTDRTNDEQAEVTDRVQTSQESSPADVTQERLAEVCSVTPHKQRTNEDRGEVVGHEGASHNRPASEEQKELCDHVAVTNSRGTDQEAIGCLNRLVEIVLNVENSSSSSSTIDILPATQQKLNSNQLKVAGRINRIGFSEQPTQEETVMRAKNRVDSVILGSEIVNTKSGGDIPSHTSSRPRTSGNEDGEKSEWVIDVHQSKQEKINDEPSSDCIHEPLPVADALKTSPELSDDDVMASSVDDVMFDSPNASAPLSSIHSTPGSPVHPMHMPSFEDWNNLPPLSPIPPSPEGVSSAMDHEISGIGETTEDVAGIKEFPHVSPSVSTSAVTDAKLSAPVTEVESAAVQKITDETSAVKPVKYTEKNNTDVAQVSKHPLDRAADVNEKTYVLNLLTKLKNDEITTEEITKRFSIVTNLRASIPFVSALVEILKQTPEGVEHALVKTFAEQYECVKSQNWRKEWQPVLTEFEMRATIVIRNLSKCLAMRSVFPSLFRLLGKVMCTSFKYQEQDSAVLAICRLYAVAGRLSRDARRIRLFCYDVMRDNRRHLLTEKIIMSVSLVWPEVLWMEEHPPGKLDLMFSPYPSFLSTLKTIIMSRATESENSTHVFRLLCGWSEVRNGKDALEAQAFELVRVLRESSSVTLETKPGLGPCIGDKAFETIKSLELLAVVLGWEWTNDILIRQHLWPIFQEWKAKKLSKVDLTERQRTELYTSKCNNTDKVDPENQTCLPKTEETLGMSQSDGMDVDHGIQNSSPGNENSGSDNMEGDSVTCNQKNTRGTSSAFSSRISENLNGLNTDVNSSHRHTGLKVGTNLQSVNTNDKSCVHGGLKDEQRTGEASKSSRFLSKIQLETMSAIPTVDKPYCDSSMIEGESSVVDVHSTMTERSTSIGTVVKNHVTQQDHGATLQNNNNMEVVIASILRLLGLLGAVGIQQGKVKLDALVNLVCAVLTGANDNDGVTFGIQIAAAYAAVDMFKAKPEKIRNVLNEWTTRMEKTNGINLSPYFTRRIRIPKT